MLSASKMISIFAKILTKAQKNISRPQRVKANLSATIAQCCVSSGTHLTTQIPSHGLGEPVAYGFQTLAKGAAL